jgi:two-component system, NtrC family, sensor kinase
VILRTLRQGARRSPSLVSRVVVAFLVVLLCFSGALGVALVSLRQAEMRGRMLRHAYVPLALSVRDLVSLQEAWNAQVLGALATSPRYDRRPWLEATVAEGRPRRVAAFQASLDRALGRSGATPTGLWEEFSGDLTRLKRLWATDQANVQAMFAALDQGDRVRAERSRIQLTLRGRRAENALRRFEDRLTAHVDALLDAARASEERIQTVVLLASIAALLTGVLMILYARRAVLPVVRMTARAEAVAAGDLSGRPPITTDDEIGTLSRTFEAMVAAISETRRRLLATERLAAMGNLAAHVTHEVRNPLSTIALNLELLRDEVSVDQKEAQQLIMTMEREVERLRSVSEQYLSMARQREPHFERVDLAEMLLGIVDFVRPEFLREAKELGFEGENRGPLEAEVDPGLVRQAVINLIQNAREASPRGTKVTLGLSPAEDEIAIYVEDQGPGLGAEAKGRLFEPYFSTKAGGTGLGLAVTEQVARAHGGELRYEREAETSRFSFTVRPASQPSTSEAQGLRMREATR